MLIIGLTGGIGSGKSTVATLFEALGTPIIDTDQLAHKLVRIGQPAYQKIVAHFGKEMLDNKNEINRIKLRNYIFQHPAEREWLEACLHPQIRNEMWQVVKRLTNPYCLISIPLLFETKPNFLIQRILVTDCSEEQQRVRVRKRDKMAEDQINAILKRQVSREQRLRGADDVIYNDQDIAYLKQQVQRLHQHFLRIYSSF